MATFLSPSVPLLASGLFSGAGKLVNALFDDTFTDIYRLQPFDYAILVPYFAFRNLAEVLGPGVLPRLFFTDRVRPAFPPTP